MPETIHPHTSKSYPLACRAISRPTAFVPKLLKKRMTRIFVRWRCVRTAMQVFGNERSRTRCRQCGSTFSPATMFERCRDSHASSRAQSCGDSDRVLISSVHHAVNVFLPIKEAGCSAPPQSQRMSAPLYIRALFPCSLSRHRRVSGTVCAGSDEQLSFLVHPHPPVSGRSGTCIDACPREFVKEAARALKCMRVNAV